MSVCNKKLVLCDSSIAVGIAFVDGLLGLVLGNVVRISKTLEQIIEEVLQLACVEEPTAVPVMFVEEDVYLVHHLVVRLSVHWTYMLC